MSTRWTAYRLGDGPIVTPDSHASIGINIQGPSLIRVPEWVERPLSRYYLYFADHKGAYIRLAVADDLGGPWRVYEDGSLQLRDSGFPTDDLVVEEGEMDAALARIRAQGVTLSYDPRPDLLCAHIASPDVHVDHRRQEIVMYFHGLERFGHQSTRVAVSRDGIVFGRVGDTIPNTYARAFPHDNKTYVLSMPGRFYRSDDGKTNFERGPMLFEPNMRHSAVVRRGDTLDVFWTRVGDAPESILVSSIDLSGDWNDWRVVDHGVVLSPEHPWEGSSEPLRPSERGRASGPMNELRDPCIFEEDGDVYLLYAVAGESGIALARLAPQDHG